MHKFILVSSIGIAIICLIAGSFTYFIPILLIAIGCRWFIIGILTSARSNPSDIRKNAFFYMAIGISLFAFGLFLLHVVWISSVTIDIIVKSDLWQHFLALFR